MTMFEAVGYVVDQNTNRVEHVSIGLFESSEAAISHIRAFLYERFGIREDPRKTMFVHGKVGNIAYRFEPKERIIGHYDPSGIVISDVHAKHLRCKTENLFPPKK